MIPTVVRAYWLLAFVMSADVDAATISSFSGGFANSTPGFLGD